MHQPFPTGMRPLSYCFNHGNWRSFNPCCAAGSTRRSQERCTPRRPQLSQPAAAASAVRVAHLQPGTRQLLKSLHIAGKLGIENTHYSQHDTPSLFQNNCLKGSARSTSFTWWRNVIKRKQEVQSMLVILLNKKVLASSCQHL